MSVAGRAIGGQAALQVEHGACVNLIRDNHLMTVKEIFELRKAGKTEEAWREIEPMFAVHQGHYTSIAYFWTASDLFAIRIKEKRTEEARRLLSCMLKGFPHLQDKDGRANAAIVRAALGLDNLVENFNLIYFSSYFEKLGKEHWKAQKIDNHWVPALGQRVVDHLFRYFEERADADYMKVVMPIFARALKENPNSKRNLHCLALLYKMEGDTEKAKEVYKNIMRRYKDFSACYALVSLTQDKAKKVALLCQAIVWQPQEKFRSKMRVELAGLLKDSNKSNALYELQKSRKTRSAAGNHVPDYALRMEKALNGIVPATETEEREFYVRAIGYLKENL